MSSDFSPFNHISNHFRRAEICGKYRIVYTAETVLKTYSDSMQWIPSVGQECLKLNPNMKCAEPPYEFCEYLDGEACASY